MKRARLAAVGLMCWSALWTSGASAQVSTSVAAPLPRPRVSAASYLQVAEHFFRSGNYESARFAFESAHSANPSRSDALLGLGKALSRLGRTSEAERALQQALELDAFNPNIHIARSEARWRPWEAGAAARLAEVHDELSSQLNSVATAMIERGRSTDAAQIRNHEGTMARLLERNEAAALHFAEAARLAPNEIAPLLNAAETASARGRAAAALSHGAAALRLNPRDSAARAYFARLLAEGGDLAGARAHADLAVRLAPESAYVSVQHAWVHYLSGKTKIARLSLEKADLLQKTRSSDASLLHGRLALDNNRNDEARGHFSVAARSAETRNESAQKRAESRFWLALALERGAAPERQLARDNYAEAVRLNPRHAEAAAALKRF